jgi:hypothetical protein
MPKKKKPRATILPVVAAIVRPVHSRLSRMEDLLVEMRHEQLVALRKLSRLQEPVDALTEALRRRRARQ